MKKTTITAVAVGCTALILLSAVWISSALSQSETAVSSSLTPSIPVNSTANEESSQENLTNSSSSEKPVSTSEEMEYILKAYEGHIGIFREGESIPIEEMDVSLEDLPQADQEMLREGIPAKDKESLRSIMEDYES